MGMFGNRRPQSAAQQVAAGGDGVDPSTVPPRDPRNRVFGDGGIGGIASGIGKILTYGPFLGIAQEGMNRRRQIDDSNMAYKEAMAKHASEPQPTDVMKEALAMGYQPGTPEFSNYITKYRMKPNYMVLGNPETGQTVIDPSAVQQPSGPPPEAVAHLRSDPSLAAQFDETFGPGAAARAMGSQ